MGVRSDNFSKLIALIVVENKQSVVAFLRSQGINANSSASNSAIIQAIGKGMQSDKFVQAFTQWIKNTYESQSNFNYKGMSGGFDPMATQDGGSFDAMSSQEGANLMEDNFANASGFDPMETQSGNFSPIDTQNGANLKDDRFANMGHEAMASGFDPMETQSGGFTPISTQGGQYANFFNSDKEKTYTKFDPNKAGTGSGVGNFLRDLGGADGILKKYLSYREQDKASSDARALANAEVEAKRLELETALALGKLKQEEYDRQMNRLDGVGQGGGGNTVLYIVLGVVLLGAIGTTIYFATRKK